MEFEKTLNTPVVMLKNYLQKKNLPFPECSYNHFSNPDHFECHISFSNSSWIGLGNSKKSAKHNAALLLMADKFPWLLKYICKQYLSKELKMFCNVNHLNNICNKMKIKPPIYKSWRNGGPEHKPIYTNECLLFDLNLKSTAEGLSQKEAKQMVAQKMIKLILEQQSLDDTSSCDTEISVNPLTNNKKIQ